MRKRTPKIATPKQLERFWLAADPITGERFDAPQPQRKAA